MMRKSPYDSLYNGDQTRSNLQGSCWVWASSYLEMSSWHVKVGRFLVVQRAWSLLLLHMHCNSPTSICRNPVVKRQDVLCLQVHQAVGMHERID